MDMPEIDKAIKYIATLYKMDKVIISEVESNKNNILIICYEDFFSQPYKIINQFSLFLNKEPFENMNEILAREKCPQNIPLSDRKWKLEEMKKIASFKIIDELLECSRDYEKIWGLPACV
jgi:hypothetical protein